jgi:hypothetical protein
MDGVRTVTPQDLQRSVGAAASPVIVDVLSPKAFHADDVRGRRDAVAEWRARVSKDRPVVLHGAYGFDVGSSVTSAPQERKFNEKYLQDSLAGWPSAVGDPASRPRGKQDKELLIIRGQRDHIRDLSWVPGSMVC